MTLPGDGGSEGTVGVGQGWTRSVTYTIPPYSYRLAEVVECTGHPIDVQYGSHRGHVDEASIFALTRKGAPR